MGYAYENWLRIGYSIDGVLYKINHIADDGFGMSQQYCYGWLIIIINYQIILWVWIRINVIICEYYVYILVIYFVLVTLNLSSVFFNILSTSYWFGLFLY